MATEIIDLTGSPSPSPPPPRSSMAPRILDFGSGSGSGSVIPYQPNFNPNFRYTNLQQTSLWQASGHTYYPSQIAATFQHSMHGGQVATVFEPVPDSNAVLFPNGTRFREPWTQREHEYGRGRWSKIARHFLWNKTPQQVQNYAASFFRHLPATCLYSFRRRNVTQYPPPNTMMTSTNVNRNLIGASASYSVPMIANEPQEPQPLMLFPERGTFSPVPVPPGGEASSSNAITTYGCGYQMETGSSGASTSITASGNGEVDLELRLGY